MNRHVLIGRLGTLDRTPVPAAADEVATQLQLVAAKRRLDHGIGRALDDLRMLGLSPSELGLDLLVLAAHVHAADTRISRLTESQDSWTRELRLVVPVSDPTRWAAVGPLLERLLDFLTGDWWAVGFRARPKGFVKLVTISPAGRRDPVFDGVSLFSGGLDSLIGAIDTIEAGGKPLLVSHAGEGATSDAQSTCFAALRSQYTRRPFQRLRLWMNFPDGLVEGVGSENTTRSRSFLFFALGIFAGAGLSKPFTLGVPENGLIALNVPLDPLRLGSLSTRTTHPFYMARWNELLGELGIPGRVENLYWAKTKGEMASECTNPGLLRSIVANSLSCASPTKGRWKGHGIEHCGYCLPCLIRRAAIGVALGQGNDPTTYTVANLAAQVLDTRQAEGQQVRSFQLAISRLRARPGLAKLLIHKPGPLSDEPDRLDALAGVYRRGLDEVGSLLAHVRAEPV